MENQLKYYKSDFTPIDNERIWLFEYHGTSIIREIGINANGEVTMTLPNKEFPRGLFADSPIVFYFNDLTEISREDFENKWKLKNTP